MRIYGFDEKVLQEVRKVIPSGDVKAVVSREFAKVWCDSVDVVTTDFNEPESIDNWPGLFDGEGALTYELNDSLEGFTLLVPSLSLDSDYMAIDVARVLW